MEKDAVIMMLWVDIGILILLAIDVYISYQNLAQAQSRG
jgi:hypothetical protein